MRMEISPRSAIRLMGPRGRSSDRCRGLQVCKKFVQSIGFARKELRIRVLTGQLLWPARGGKVSIGRVCPDQLDQPNRMAFGRTRHYLRNAIKTRLNICNGL